MCISAANRPIAQLAKDARTCAQASAAVDVRQRSGSDVLWMLSVVLDDVSCLSCHYNIPTYMRHIHYSIGYSLGK